MQKNICACVHVYQKPRLNLVLPTVLPDVRPQFGTQVSRPEPEPPSPHPDFGAPFSRIRIRSQFSSRRPITGSDGSGNSGFSILSEAKTHHRAI